MYSYVMKVWWKSVPGSWTGLEEFCSCSWQNVSRWASVPKSISATGCRNCGNTVWKVYIIYRSLLKWSSFFCPTPYLLTCSLSPSCKSHNNFITWTGISPITSHILKNFTQLLLELHITMAWNTLQDNLQDPAMPPHTFTAGLKTLLLSSY